MPVAYLTAYYALLMRGGMRAGQRVLVHSGTGAVGLAAIRIARFRGCEARCPARAPRLSETCSPSAPRRARVRRRRLWPLAERVRRRPRVAMLVRRRPAAHGRPGGEGSVGSAPACAGGHAAAARRCSRRAGRRPSARSCSRHSPGWTTRTSATRAPRRSRPPCSPGCAPAPRCGRGSPPAGTRAGRAWHVALAALPGSAPAQALLQSRLRPAISRSAPCRAVLRLACAAAGGARRAARGRGARAGRQTRGAGMGPASNSLAADENPVLPRRRAARAWTWR